MGWERLSRVTHSYNARLKIGLEKYHWVVKKNDHLGPPHLVSPFCSKDSIIVVIIHYWTLLQFTQDFFNILAPLKLPTTTTTTGKVGCYSPPTNGLLM